jgi:hypothetical protein
MLVLRAQALFVKACVIFARLSSHFVDVDACVANECDANASCVDVPAPSLANICICNLGYVGNGTACTGAFCHT